MSEQATIHSGLADKALHAASKLPRRRDHVDFKKDLTPKEPKPVTETTAGLAWTKLDKPGKPGENNDLGIAVKGAEDLSFISVAASALNRQTVESARPTDLQKDKLTARIGKLKEKIVKHAVDSFSDKLFTSLLAGVFIGVTNMLLSKYGVSSDEICVLLKEGKEQAKGNVDGGMQQVASEKVLYSVVTGARIV